MRINSDKLIRHASRVTRHDSQASPITIKNLIFDFGGVLCNIDPDLTKQAFIKLGLKKFDTGDSITRSKGLFEQLEIGVIAPQDFRDKLRPFFEHPVSDDQIDAAWNALLLDLPEHRVRLLESLRKNYRIFLLSNSNEIHYLCYAGRLQQQYGYADFDALFEKAWFSFRIGLKKPSPEIFRFVTRDAGLDPAETLFIDDTLVHVEGARSAGLQAYHLDLLQGENIGDLFRS
jgi:HAD superfamily hydrolase (TIGR01509 family)